jgi:hypothetical protein
MSDRSRRWLGAILGAITGLGFSLVSEYINVAFLPGVPLHHPGPSRLAVVLLGLVGGGLLGYITAWPEEAAPGILAGMLLGTLASSLLGVWTTTSAAQRTAGAFVVLVITFLPRTFLLLPFSLGVRWVLGQWMEELQGVNFSVRRLVTSVLVLVGLAIAAGAFSLYPERAREALQITNNLIVEGRRAGSSAELPKALDPVDGFLNGSQAPYRLELTTDADQIPVQRVFTNYTEEVYGVIARFDSGLRFGCVFTPQGSPGCEDY